MTISSNQGMSPIRDQYEDFVRQYMRSDAAKNHLQAAADLSSAPTPLCITNAVIRMSDPANDAYYAHTQHRVGIVSALTATMLLPGAGMAISYLDTKLKPHTVLTKGLEKPGHIEGSRWVTLYEVDQEDYVLLPIDGIFKLTMETMSFSS